MIYKKREVLETVLSVICEGSLYVWQVVSICKDRYGLSKNTVLKSISRLHTMGNIRMEILKDSKGRRKKLYITNNSL